MTVSFWVSFETFPLKLPIETAESDEKKIICFSKIFFIEKEVILSTVR